MTVENFDSTLQTLLNRTPFQVFTVELNGGHRFEIDPVRAVAYNDRKAVFIAPGGALVIFDHESMNLFISEGANSLPPGGGT